MNAVRVKFLAECKKIPEEPEKYCFWQFCRKFTHFPSVKFSWLKMCACKKDDKYQVCVWESATPPTHIKENFPKKTHSFFGSSPKLFSSNIDFVDSTARLAV